MLRRWLVLFTNARKTDADLSAPPQELPSSVAVWRRAAASFALFTKARKTAEVHFESRITPQPGYALGRSSEEQASSFAVWRRAAAPLALSLMAGAGLLGAAEYHGQVLYNGLPVPGAVLTATSGTHKETAATDERGLYSFPDLADGQWTVDVDMTGFAHLQQTVVVGAGMKAGRWELQMLPADEILAAKPIAETPEMPPADQAIAQDAAEGLLISGSEENAATSTFKQDASFGNNKKRAAGLYNGGIGMIFENSALDAAPYSLTGQNTLKPSYNDVTGVVNLGGPLRIPHLLRNGPVFFIGYQWTRNRNAVTETALVPAAAQRNLLPPNQVSPVAQALLGLYPLPNFSGSSRYNFQIPAVTGEHQDSLQARLDKNIKRNELTGLLALQSTRQDTPNVLGYSDSSDTFGLHTRLSLSRSLHHGLVWNASYDFSRYATTVTPYFAHRSNISGNAGVSGNDQTPLNWGPPTLLFASGIASLTDAIPARNRDQTSTGSSSLIWTHRTHSVTAGGDYRREQLNLFTQQDPRGTLSFTGAATGSDFTDFLRGTPDTSSIAFGNADKYLRESGYDGYIADDWRASASLTLNAGVRWEYAAPITELYNRLVNLDVTADFASVTPVVAGDPRLPRALMRPDRAGWQPRVGLAWRAPGGSSLVVRAGYGVYDDTSVYESIARQLAQQPPFSKTLSIQNSPASPLTLADPFNQPATGLRNTFGIDPNFRIGYVQDWQISVQRDLPWSLIALATYSGIKGTRGPQEFLPNTVPPGGVANCPACPNGFVYLTSNGNSSREALQMQLRRRLHNGLTAALQYTYAKSLDDDSFLGGQGAGLTANSSAAPQNSDTLQTQPAAIPSAAIAQNWMNLAADRGPSTFDQRQLFALKLQYTSGMGVKGGTLLKGWRGALLKEWSIASQMTAGSGLPENPVYFSAIPGTGFTGTERPNYTGAPLHTAGPGPFLNPAAFSEPFSGEWGNAGRNSIGGPMQFGLDATLGRTFRLKDRFNLDLRFDATNALNHVTYTGWNTVINNAQFGLPVAANSMRTIQTTLRLRF